MNVVPGVRMQIRVWGGDAGKEWIQGRYHFECMCQFGIRKDCFGLQEPNLPPPHRQKKRKKERKILLKPQNCPRSLHYHVTQRSTTRIRKVGKKWRNKDLPLHSGLRWNNLRHSFVLLVVFWLSAVLRWGAHRAMYITGIDGKWHVNEARVEN